MNKNYFSGLTRDTLLLTFTSFFADISTEMLYPILPVFLIQQLHATGSIVGLIEGIATATQNIVQGFSGWYADTLRRRKLIALSGYAIAALSKPLIGLATVWPYALTARSMDRLGTGVRSAPRDGLIAASASEESRGKAFGLEGIGDNLGACIGPLITVLLLTFLHVPFRTLFFLTCIPGGLALLMVLFVKERKNISARVIADTTVSLSRPYYSYLFIAFCIGLSMMSTSFLILRIKELGIPLTTTILIYAGFNLVAAIVSYPAGYMADLWGRKWVFVIGLMTLVISYGGFAASAQVRILTLMFACYGVYQGVFRAVGKALATDLVARSRRSTGVGWYSATIGISGLCASVLAGQLWDHMGHTSIFIYGMVCASIGMILLLYVPLKKEEITH